MRGQPAGASPGKQKRWARHRASRLRMDVQWHADAPARLERPRRTGICDGRTFAVERRRSCSQIAWRFAAAPGRKPV